MERRVGRQERENGKWAKERVESDEEGGSEMASDWEGINQPHSVTVIIITAITLSSPDGGIYGETAATQPDSLE